MPLIEPAISIWQLLPELILAAAGCGVLLMGPASRPVVRGAIPAVTLLSIIAATIVVFVWFGEANAVGSGFVFGRMTYFVRLSALVLGVLITTAAWSQSQEMERGEFFSMVLFSLVGLLLVAPADNLVILFVALELVSIPTYVLVTLSRMNLRALEAGTKYFYLGAMSAAVMAYGFAFLFGVSGTASLSQTVTAVREALAAGPGTLAYNIAVIGLLLSLGGLFFKIAAVPLHFYIADVYQGAANPIAGMLGFVPKLAGFVAILKVISLTNLWDGRDEILFWALWLVAVFSMTLGNVLALMQSNIKRMLAYSGIAHSGYMLVAVLAGPGGGGAGINNGAAAILYYTVVYGIANLAGFAILGVLRVRGQTCETVRDVAGLLRREPGLALLMALTMFTLMGLPPTPGFWGKLSLFGSALAAGNEIGGDRGYWMIVLVVIGVLNSAIAAAYYLRVAAAVLLYESEEPAEADPYQDLPNMGAFMCGFLLLVFSLYPNALMRSGVAATGDFGPDHRMIAARPAPEAQRMPPPVFGQAE